MEKFSLTCGNRSVPATPAFGEQTECTHAQDNQAGRFRGIRLDNQSRTIRRIHRAAAIEAGNQSLIALKPQSVVGRLASDPVLYPGSIERNLYTQADNDDIEPYLTSTGRKKKI